MNHYSQMLSKMKHSPAMERFSRLYGRRDGELARQLSRYTSLVKAHEELFHADEKPLYLISAPGRTEIIGNHTDHNKGLVMAAAVNLDCIACVFSSVMDSVLQAFARVVLRVSEPFW